jgi:hypothetical protein
MNLISAKLWVITAILIPLSGTLIVLSSTASGDTIQCIQEEDSCFSNSTSDNDVMIGSEPQSDVIFALAGNDAVYMHLEARIT